MSDVEIRRYSPGKVSLVRNKETDRLKLIRHIEKFAHMSCWHSVISICYTFIVYWQLNKYHTWCKSALLVLYHSHPKWTINFCHINSPTLISEYMCVCSQEWNTNKEKILLRYVCIICLFHRQNKDTWEWNLVLDDCSMTKKNYADKYYKHIRIHLW